MSRSGVGTTGVLGVEGTYWGARRLGGQIQVPNVHSFTMTQAKK